MPKSIRKIIKFSKTKNKIKYGFLHQANKIINNSIINKLNYKKINFFSSLELYGNTSCASIPITITDSFQKKGNISGTSIISGFGVGLSMCSAIINFNKTHISKLLQI